MNSGVSVCSKPTLQYREHSGLVRCLAAHVRRTFGNSAHDWQHLLFQQHIPIISAIDFDAWFNKDQLRATEF